MSVLTLEAFVDHGQIRLPADVRLPERTRVYVLIPDVKVDTARIESPRLAHPEQGADFVMEVTRSDAEL